MAQIKNKQSQANFELDIQGIQSQFIDKSFGRPEDVIELHIYDLKDNLLYSEYNFKDYTFANTEVSPSTILEPTTLEPAIQDSTAKGAGDKDYIRTGPNNAKEGYWFNTGKQQVWVSTSPSPSLSEGLTSELEVNPPLILAARGYTTGKYIIKLNIQRNKILNLTEDPFIIKEISPTRREIKSITPKVDNQKLGPSVNAFIYEMEGSIYFKDFIINFGKDINVAGINILLNKNASKYEVLLKTLDPLPTEIQSRSPFKIAENISDPITYEVNLGEPSIPDISIPLRGPNYKIDIRMQNSVPSCFKNYNELLAYNLTSSYQNLINKLDKNEAIHIDYSYIRPISESMEGIDIPYHFENFVHFGSAFERLKNFEYKLQLLETYDSKITKINKITGPTSSSSHILQSKEEIEDTKTNLLKGLDGYERFLYYESESFAWPKSTTEYPYTLHSPTGSEAKSWLGSELERNEFYGGQLLSASLYDRHNIHSLSDLIPNHVRDNIDNNLYTTFIDMVGQHFDYIWTYIKHQTEINDTHHKKGISKDLVYYALKSLGIEAFDQFENADLLEYVLGISDLDHTVGNFIVGSWIIGGGKANYFKTPPGQTLVTSSAEGSTPKGDITKEIWKRLYHNAPYLLKTKGTERGIKALMSCYGVPSTILNIKEYGGSTSDKTTYQTFSYDKASLALNGNAGDSNYFVKTKWSSSLTNKLSSSAKTVAFRINPERKSSNTKNYHLFNLSGSNPAHDHILVLNPHTGTDISSSGDHIQYGKLDLYSGSYLRASTSNFPVYNGEFWNIFIGTNGASGSTDTLKFGAYQSNHLKNIFSYTSSTALAGGGSASWGDPFSGTDGITVYGGAHSMYIGGTEANKNAHYDNLDNLSYSGSIQEVRIYHHTYQSTNDSSVDRMLSHDTLKKQSLSPFIYAGNHPSSSYDELIFRAPLGSNLHQNSSSFHPNIDIDYLGVGSGVSSSMQSQKWKEIEEVHHLLTPDTVGASMTSEKVRLDSGSVDDNILSHNGKSETSTLDRQPQDFEDLGVFLSPTTEINEDIIYTLGAFRLDDYIGSPLPRHQTSSYYTDLKTIRDVYTKKLKSRYNLWDYIKLIQQIDHTLFKMIEQWVPFKSNLKTGLLIEPHYLERTKFAREINFQLQHGQLLMMVKQW